MADMEFPMVQGAYTSWAEIRPVLEIQDADSMVTKDFVAIKWGHKLTPGEVDGVGPMPRGATVGTYTKQAEMQMLYAKAVEFRKKLKVAAQAKGHERIGLVYFDLILDWAPLDDINGAIFHCHLHGCRLIGGDWDTAPGPDALVETMPLYVTLVEDNDTRLV